MGISRTRKNIVGQIQKVIENYITEDGQRVVEDSSSIAPFGIGDNFTSPNAISALEYRLSQTVKPWIRGLGGNVVATDPPSSSVRVLPITTGGVIAGGNIFYIPEEVELDLSDYLWTDIYSAAKSGEYYIQVNDEGVYITKTRQWSHGVLAKIVIPSHRTSKIVDNNNWELNPQPTSFFGGNTDGYIISARDPFFDEPFGLANDDYYLRALRDGVKHIFAENIYGDLVVNEKLTITNIQGTVSLDSEKMEFKNSDGEIVAQYGGKLFYLGNIEIVPDAIQSRDFDTGNSGFQIASSGNAEFNNITARGTIYAEAGWFGGVAGWAISDGAILSASATNFSIGLITETFPGFSDRMIFIRGNSGSGLPSYGDAGIQLYHDVSGGLSKFYAGDGSNNYFEFNGSSTEVQGVIKATSGWFGGSGGWAVGTGAILSASATNFSIGLVTEAFSGFSDRMIFIRGNSGSGLPSFGDAGIQLYHDVSGNLSKFYVGDGGDNYFEFNGVSTVEHQGVVKAVSGWFGGSGGWAIGTGAILSASATNFSIGLVTESFSGFSDRMIFVRGSSGSGLPSFGDEGIQLYHDVSASEAQFHVGDEYSGGSNFLHYTPSGGLEVAGSFTVTEVGKWYIDGDILEARDAGDVPIMALVSDGNDATPNPHIWIKDSTFGSEGIQLQYNAGDPRFYVGDGSNQFVKHDGTNFSFKGTNTELSAAGVFTATAVSITGTVVATAGYIGTAVDGWVIESGKITSTGGDIEISSENNRIDVGSPAVGDGIRINSTGMNLYNSGTLKGQWQVDSEWWLGESTTNRKVSWNPDTDTFTVRGNAAFDTLVWQEVLTTKGSLLVAKSGGELYEDMTATGTTFTVKVKEPVSGGAPFSSGDILKIDNGLSSTWFTVGSGTDQGEYYQYTGTYQSGSSSATYYEGTGIVDYGQSGDGYLEMVADPSGSEDIRYSVKTHAGSPWATETELVRTGNLNGYLGIASDEYGFAAGSSAGTHPNIIVSPTYGFKLRRGTTTSMHFDTDGTFEITGDGDNKIAWDGATLSIRGALVADDITSGIITSLRFRTAETGTRLELNYDVYHLVTYDSSGNRPFRVYKSGTYVDDVMLGNISSGSEGYVWWDSSESRLKIRGSINADDIEAGTISGDYITGGTIEGTTIQTASSGQRIVINGNSNVLNFYDSTGALGLEIDTNTTFIPGLTTAYMEGANGLIINITNDDGTYNAPGLVVNRGTNQALVYGDKFYIRDTSVSDRMEMHNDALYFYQGSSSPYAKIIADTQGSGRTYTIPDAGTNAKFVLNYGVNVFGAGSTSSNDPYIVIGRSITGSGNAHAFVDESSINKSGTIGYNSFDSDPTITGSYTYDHIVGFQSRPSFRSSGDITYLYGFTSAIDRVTSGTITDAVHYKAKNLTGSGGTITNQYGFYVSEALIAATNNWAFYSVGATKSRLGGNLELESALVFDTGTYNATLSSETLTDSDKTFKLPDPEGALFVLPASEDDTDREACHDLDKTGVRSKSWKIDYNFPSTSTSYTDLLDFPANTLISSIKFYVRTQFVVTGSGSGTLAMRFGSSGHQDRYIDDLDITAIASATWQTITKTEDFRPSADNLVARLLLTSGDSCTEGEAYLWVEYSEISDVDTLTS